MPPQNIPNYKNTNYTILLCKTESSYNYPDQVKVKINVNKK